MKLEFMPQAMETFQRIKAQSPDIYEKLKAVIKDTLDHPETGIGNPTSLEGSYKGLWERRVSFEDGFYYAFDADRLVILGVSSSAAQTHGITLESLTASMMLSQRLFKSKRF